MSELPTIDGYVDLVPIGRGGLGDVYRAVQTATGAAVAIKILRDVSDSSVAWHRTRRELNALLALSGHANVVQIVELLELPSGPALVMEHAPGGSVSDLLRDRGGTLSVDETVFVGRQTAAALVSAHARGIVHRDIKPQNLLVDADGQVQLCDFGIAALTRDDEYRSRTNAISMRYASPEDLEQHDREHDREHDDAEHPGGDELAVGPASDVYSLGATLLHIARGAPPTIRERLAPWVPPATGDAQLAALDRVVARCLHPAPSVRPTAQALADALDGLSLGAGAARVTALPVIGRSPAPAAPPERSPAAVGARPAPRHPARLDADVDADAVTRQRPGEVSLADRPVELPRPVEVGPRWHRPLLGVIAALVVAAAAIVLWPSDDVAAPGPSTPAPSTAAVPTPIGGPVTRPRPDGLAPLTDPAVVWTVGRVGDCLVQVPDRTALSVVPCSEPHDLQRYVSGSVVDLGVDTDAAFDQAAIADAVTAACVAAFEPFVGTPPTSSALQTAQTRPNADTWTAGDREYHCSVGVEDARVVGDAAGTGW